MILYATLDSRRTSKTAKKGDDQEIIICLSKKGTTEFNLRYTEEGLSLVDSQGAVLWTIESESASRTEPHHTVAEATLMM